jgi:hypothetical protein
MLPLMVRKVTARLEKVKQLCNIHHCLEWKVTYTLRFRLKCRPTNLNMFALPIIGVWCGNLKETHHLDKLGVDGRVVLK